VLAYVSAGGGNGSEVYTTNPGSRGVSLVAGNISISEGMGEPRQEDK
jgi:hypothetical protein